MEYPPDDDHPPIPAEEDARIERVVLRATLFAYPELYTKNDLVREISTEPGNFAARDAIERIVLELATIGLLHSVGPLVVPSRAALHFHRLDHG